MHLKQYALPALALLLGAAFPLRIHAASPPPEPPTYGQDYDRGWDVPPQELNEIQRRGFRDGIEGARRDFDNHRQPDVNNRDEYRHPNLPPEEREVYRDGFRRGYDRAMSHLMRGPVAAPPPPPPPPPPVAWDAPPGEFNEIQRRGFHDGVEGARRDYDNHRRPDVNNRDEYRHPDVPPPYRHDYREAFRRGYAVGVRHLMGGRGPY
ncbi:MAG TPA: hypothetical protein VKR52_18595 [Terracidiphilus sp.]|nr:hypothetical protein [Terracidiphilus sp.]